MGKRAAAEFPPIDCSEAGALCGEVQRLSLEAHPRADAESCAQVGAEADRFDSGEQLQWYERLLPFVVRCEQSVMDWQAWANRGACLRHLGEQSASWHAYVQAATAARGFEVELGDDDLLADPRVGRFLRVLDREFRGGGGWAETDREPALFARLVREGRACELATERWHEILPNHHWAASRALIAQLALSSPKPLHFREVFTDDSRPELQRGNTLALLAAPGEMFAQKDAKRARLSASVVDLKVELRSTAEGFEVISTEEHRPEEEEKEEESGD